MAGLFERIRDIFDNLFIRDPKELQKRRELRKIHDYLKSLKPSYYRQFSGEVLPGFANILLDFTRTLKPLCELLSKTISNDESKIAQLYKNYLVEKRLSERDADRVKMLTYENVKDRILKSPSPETELKIIGNEIQEVIQSLSSPEFNNFDLEYNQLNRLTSICKLDFEKVLRMFDMKVSIQSREYKPHFSPVLGDQILNDLLDIYFVLWGFNPELGLERNLSALMERLLKIDIDEVKLKLRKIINRLKQLLKRHMAQSTILMLIRAIKNDPFFNPETDKEFHPYLENYKRKLLDKYILIRDKLLRERRENAISQDITALFEKAELLDIRGYTEAQSEILTRENLPGFKYVKPLRIIKSFIVAKFEKNIREDVNKLLVEGFFENKIFQDSFSNTYYKCTSLLDELSNLEESLNGESKFSITSLNRYLKAYSDGKKIESVIVKIKDSIDSNVLKFIEDTTASFYKLASFLKEVLNDYKQNTPSYISNIKVIGGVKNREYIASLLNDYNDIIKLIRIMKNFTIIKPSLEEARVREKIISEESKNGKN